MYEMRTDQQQARDWIRFLRQYGPVPQNENMYDEFIRRSADRAGVAPLHFEHPAANEVLGAITGANPVSVVLTGTAGDGKTHLCRRVWEAIGGDQVAWQSPSPYLSTPLPSPGEAGVGVRTLHVVRDLSAWAPQRGVAWDPERERLLQRFSASIFADVGAVGDEIFLIAANDGQLVESWRRLGQSGAVVRARDVIETLLVEDRRELADVRLRFYNLSRQRSTDILDRALAAFLDHPAWETCRALAAGPHEFFGPRCPIRHNLALLGTPLVRQRLRALLALCDHNRLHLPIRQILLLLTNAVLGHPEVRDRLMTSADVPRVIRAGTLARASLYSNIFGGNLPTSRRESILAFDALNRFGIGFETSNRVDNILIFGEADEGLQPYFARYMASDEFYGADASYRAAQREYVEGAEGDEERGTAFLRLLVAQRQGLFFKIHDSESAGMHLWDLTVFRYAGEYLDRVVGALEAGRRVDRPILERLVRGLNRVFTGMLVADERDLLLATSLAVSQGRVSHLLEDRVSVIPRLGERVELIRDESDGIPGLEVTLSRELRCVFPLHLTRYEFLSRVAEGALPSSFSRECYEDALAFKSRLLTALGERRAANGEVDERGALSFRLLQVEATGRSSVRDLEIREVEGC